MKKIIIPVAVLVAAGLVGPKVTGSGFNSSLDSFVEKVNTTPGYTATIDSRTTGWFSSEAVVTLGISTESYEGIPMSESDLAELKESMQVSVNVEGQHGPVLTLNGFGLGLSAFKVTSAEDAFRGYLDYAADTDFYALEGQVGLFGGTSYADAIPAFTAKPEISDGNDVTFSGWTGSGSSADGSTLYKGGMDEFSVVGQGNEFKISNVTSDFDMELSLSEMLDSVFYNSDANITFGSIVLDMPVDGLALDMENFVLDMNSTTKEDGALMDIGMDYLVDSVSAPNFEAKDLVVKTEINNLEKVLFETLQSLSDDPMKMQEVMGDIMTTKLLAQLKTNPEVNITELSGTINDGVMNAKFLSKLQGIEEMPAMMEDPSFWLSKAVVDADVKMDKTMAMWVGTQVVASQMAADPSTAGMTDAEIQDIASQQVEGMLGMFAAQGMLVVNEEGGYEMAFTMEDGQATLNGNPMPLPL
jgi:uncharacterized protein YdgA (DUF945 family)